MLQRLANHAGKIASTKVIFTSATSVLHACIWTLFSEVFASHFAQLLLLACFAHSCF